MLRQRQPSIHPSSRSQRHESPESVPPTRERAHARARLSGAAKNIHDRTRSSRPPRRWNFRGEGEVKKRCWEYIIHEAGVLGRARWMDPWGGSLPLPATLQIKSTKREKYYFFLLNFPSSLSGFSLVACSIRPILLDAKIHCGDEQLNPARSSASCHTAREQSRESWSCLQGRLNHADSGASPAGSRRYRLSHWAHSSNTPTKSRQRQQWKGFGLVAVTRRGSLGRNQDLWLILSSHLNTLFTGIFVF